MKYLSHLIWILIFLSCKKKELLLESTAHKGHITSELQTVMYLEFNGDSSNNPGFGYIEAYPSSLTISEREVVLDSVSEYFKGLNCTVTSDKSRWDAAVWKIRCIITDNWQWAMGATGKALTGIFNTSHDATCYVFPITVQESPENTAILIAHEIGHTLGLNHIVTRDSVCQLTAYYSTGDSVEAPIMGNALGKRAKWWIGDSEIGCGVIQNDLAIIKQSLN